MITRRGTGIVVVAIAVFFLASTTRVGWVHLADAVLWGVILMSLAIPWLSMPGLKIERTVGSAERRDSPGPLEGDELPVTLTLANRWWLPRFLVSISYPVSAAGVETQNKNVFFWTWPKRNSDAESPLKLERRGQHSLGEALIEITGPFGMFRRRRRMAMNHGALVYPIWKPMQRLGIMEAQSGENEGQRKSRTGVDASGTRTYVPGDPYRSIHWRNSARSGRLAVREFDTWNDRAVVFAIDNVNISGKSPDSSIDYAARIAASCAKVIEREGGTVSVVTSMGESPEFMNWTGVMEYLARLEPDQSRNASIAEHISRLLPGKRLMAFLTPDSAQEIKAVASASQRGVACVAVLHSEAGNGSDASETHSSAAALLQGAGVPVVRSIAGGLDAALAEIESGTGAVQRSTPSRGSQQKAAA